MEALKKIVVLSGAALLATRDVATKLAPEGITVQVMEAGSFALAGFTLEAIPVRHEPILADHLPDMFAFLTDGRVLNPADPSATTYWPLPASSCCSYP